MGSIGLAMANLRDPGAQSRNATCAPIRRARWLATTTMLAALAACASDPPATTPHRDQPEAGIDAHDDRADAAGGAKCEGSTVSVAGRDWTWANPCPHADDYFAA